MGLKIRVRRFTVPIQDRKSELLEAIGRGEIVVHYQPQIAAATGSVAGVECLMRWNHPRDGLLPPGAFFNGVEDDETVIQALCETVLRQACRDALAWPGIFVGINLSPVQFRLAGFADRLIAIAREEKFPLERLELEILETSFFEDPAGMRAVLSQFRAAGVRIALDDFGTGYASLSALLDLPLDKLKIDASFVRQCDQLRPASIIHAIVALARAVGLKVTAEGVETQAQRNFLRAAGCHYLQGYLFSHPAPAALIPALIQGEAATPGAA